jgi:hypothetical protein
MTVAELALRVEVLERDIGALKQQIAERCDLRPWLERIRGRWAGDPVMKEIIDQGREFRESLRPDAKKKPRRTKRKK